MPNSLNRQCVTFSGRKIADGDVNTTSSWVINASDENAILGDPPNWTEYSKWHLGIDPNGDREVKSTYKYPVGKDGKVYRAALVAIRQRAAQQEDQEIFSSAGRLLNKIDARNEDARDEQGMTAIEIRFSIDKEKSTFSEDGKQETLNEFGGIAYSGGLIPDYGWIGDCAIDLSGLKPATVFVLVNHDEDQRAGWGEISHIGGELHITGGRFLQNDVGKRVSAELSEGAPWQFSIGMTSSMEMFEEKTPVVVNGKVLELNAIFRKPRITEVSFVPAGADPNTSVYAFKVYPNYYSPIHHIEDIPMEKVTTLENQQSELMAKVNALQKERDDLEMELKRHVELEASTRIEKLDSLNIDMEEGERRIMTDLSAEQFKVVFAILNRNRMGKLPESSHLFKGAQTVPENRETQDSLRFLDIYKRINAGVK